MAKEAGIQEPGIGRASRCFVLADGRSVAGYSCLSAGAIGHVAAPKSMRRNMPDPLPVLLLGRLAIDRSRQNRGLGRALLRDAMLRAVHIASDAGVFAILRRSGFTCHAVLWNRLRSR